VRILVPDLLALLTDEDDSRCDRTLGKLEALGVYRLEVRAQSGKMRSGGERDTLCYGNYARFSLLGVIICRIPAGEGILHR
jgi:hypothetical protein